jgi:hypothetical protein
VTTAALVCGALALADAMVLAGVLVGLEVAYRLAGVRG